MQEQRQAPRQRTLKSGKIVFNHKSCVVDCTIRNLSSRGACLDLPSPLGVPESFDLVIDADDLIRPCRVIWRSAKKLGVEFR